MPVSRRVRESLPDWSARLRKHSSLVRKRKASFGVDPASHRKKVQHLRAHAAEIEVCQPFLKYSGDQLSCEMLEAEFRRVSAARYRSLMQLICIMGCLWFLVYSFTVDQSDRWVYYAAFVFIATELSLISSRAYMRNSQIIVGTGFFLLGCAIVWNKEDTNNYSNMNPVLFCIVLFTSTPMTLVYGTLIASIVVLGYVGVSIWAWREASTNDDASLEFNTIVILAGTTFGALFFLIYVTYYREINLRRAIISQHILLRSSREVEKETKKTRDLLRSMLPDVITDLLQDREDAEAPVRIAEKFTSVTIMFVEVCDFSAISSKQTREELVDILNTIFSVFDSVLEDYDVYKVETIAEVYMVVGGCPNRSRRHAEDVAEVALEFMALMPEINLLLRQTVPRLAHEVQIRIGLNTGSIVAGVVGQRSPRFKLFGDPVNVASRMESTCPKGRIQVSGTTQALLETKFNLEYRGSISVKGKGNMDTFFLLSRKDTLERLGQNAIVKDKSEMMEHIAANNNSLFTTWSVSGFVSLPGSTKKSKVAPVPNVEAKVSSDSSIPVKEDNNSLQNIGTYSSKERSVGLEKEEERLRMYLRSKAHSARSLLTTNEGGSLDSRGLFDRYSCMEVFSRIFSVGSPEFHSVQLQRGRVAIDRFTNMLLIIVPVFLLAEVVAYLVANAMNSDDSAEAIFSSSDYIFLIAVTSAVLALSAALQVLLRLNRTFYIIGVMELTFVCATGCITYLNVTMSHPNPSFLMVLITFTFHQQLIPMSHRVLLSFATAILGEIMVYVWISVFDAEYYRYMMNLSSTMENKLNLEDILMHSAYLFITIVLQMWCVTVQDLFLFQDFCQSRLIMDQSNQLEIQKAQTTHLLSQLLPTSIVPKLMEGKQTRIVDQFESVTILFTDMVGFTKFSGGISPLSLMDFLNAMYTRFDTISEKYGLYKVEIIGDAYFVVGGCPEVSIDHTERVLRAAIEMQNSIGDLKKIAHRLLLRERDEKRRSTSRERRLVSVTRSFENQGGRSSNASTVTTPKSPNSRKGSTDAAAEERLEDALFDNEEMTILRDTSDATALEEIEEPDIQIRIGVHVGSAIAGVVGYKDPRYHIFGDSVSLANMMESKGKPSRIHISQAALDNLLARQEARDLFLIEQREVIDLSPIAPPQQTYFVSLR